MLQQARSVRGADDAALLSRREQEGALDRTAKRRTFVVTAVFLLSSATVNATTLLMEANRYGRALDWRQPFIDEFSSIAVLLALFPLVALGLRAVPITLESWRRAVPLHVLASLVFSTLHVAGMFLLRQALFPLILAVRYVVAEEPVRVAIYEYRKDALTYATFVLVLLLVQAIMEHRRELEAARSDARQSGQITLKCGGRTIWLPAGTIEWVEAAGNYVEVRANGAAHLARTSLAAIEEQLREAGLPMARVHRSYLVNRSKVAMLTPSGDGDFRIRMADGTEIRGSRRYRGNLGA